MFEKQKSSKSPQTQILFDIDFDSVLLGKKPQTLTPRDFWTMFKNAFQY